MMSGQVLSEEFLLQCTGCSELNQITELSLVDMGIDSIPEDLFMQLTNLESLDVSGNFLSSFPEDLNFFKLKRLTIENNNFNDVGFLGSLPALEEVYMENNKLTAADKLIAVSLCPKLESINKSRAVAARKLANNIKTKLKPFILQIWNEKYPDTFLRGKSKREEMKYVDMFMEDVKKVASANVHEGLVKFRNFLICQFIETVRTSPEIPSPPKKLKAIPAVTNIKNKDVSTDVVESKGSSFKRQSKKRKSLHTERNSETQPVESRLDVLPEYEPFLFLRCHSKDNDPGDCVTKVWRAEFEPSMERPGETTSIVATCGGDCLCLIDCNTGKLMKRYRQPGDQFYVVAWTTVDVKTDDKIITSNILATAGESGTIYLIHPSQCVCYAQLKKGGHHKEVASLVFHPQEKTLLFSGASDRQIILWDIGIPSFPDYKISYRILMKFRSTGGDILNMVINMENGYVFAGCNGGCFAWNLNPKGKVKQARTPDVEVILSDKKGLVVDGLVQITDDMVATKVVKEGVIILWSLKQTLASVKKNQSVMEPLAKLVWKQTEEIYLNLGHFINSGMLVCGGDDGEIYLYNIKHLLKDKNKSKCEVYEPSQILGWPSCKLSGPEEKDLTISETLKKRDCLIINGIGLNWNQEYMVAGTDNNLVCIWRHVEQS